MAADGTRDQAGEPRAVIGGAFGLLASLHALGGTARVSELQRDSGLPRTTVQRLLTQLRDVGAVERSAGRWRLGPALVELGAAVPAEPRLRSVARRPLMDLANATGALVSLTVEMASLPVIVDVFPGRSRLAQEPNPGMSMQEAKVATVRALVRAHGGDMRPVIDAGAVDPRISCVAAPLRLSRRDVAVVTLMVPGGAGVPAETVRATRYAAGRIASLLSAPG
jgi:IclR family transcriptional regulator, acetate operon repressor